MRTYIWVSFIINGLGVLLYALSLSIRTYPYTDVKKAWHHVLGLLIAIGYTLWAYAILVIK